MSLPNIPNLTRIPADLWKVILHAASSDCLVPELGEIFKPFQLCPPSATKVVIVGIEPYHARGKSSGLAYGYRSTYETDGTSDSTLSNVIKEVHASTGETVEDMTLESWAYQGVLLVNLRLTTEIGRPGAHSRMGWEQLVRVYLHALSSAKSGIVFMLWGTEAATCEACLSNKDKHLVLVASHPSRFSAKYGFEGCGHFKKANDFLVQRGDLPIRWGS